MTIKKSYLELRKIWENDTCFSSQIETDHPKFKEIVDLGKDVVPFIIEDIKVNPGWIVVALSRITSENPIKKEHAGRLHEICKDWIEWHDNYSSR